MTRRVDRDGLQVAEALAEFIEDRALLGTGISAESFWSGLSELAHELGPENRRLLRLRAEIQQSLDAWHIDRRGQGHDAAAYRAFLEEIGYLVPEGEDFLLETVGVDPEIAQVPGPQLVVPITNARFALNAANARWGSLYDALYGTDALGDLPEAGGYDAERGLRVIRWGRHFLNDALPLNGQGWEAAEGLAVVDGALSVMIRGGEVVLADPSQFVGYVGAAETPNEVILKNNGLHIRIQINDSTDVGAADVASISDIILESALSTIMDCEDSVAAVDAEDKVQAYGNWLGLMRGDLEERVEKGGRVFNRRLAADLAFSTADGTDATLKGRALMLVRNVGHLMTNPAVLDRDGNEIGEGLLDALTTVTIAMHDLNKSDGARNSVAGSVYVVKPKMHGPEEVAFADEIFTRVERILGLPQYSVKLGIMDEERRTSVNLKECIRAAKHRVAFINTGFLDRTGDEIHSSMEAGPFLRKGEMKATPWITSYEDRNVDIGLACGLQGKAQIGKGMWAMPDLMAEMLKAKIAHPQSGANCAWVPSPTAATLHATHYHQVDVLVVQGELKEQGARGSLDDLLTIPVMKGENPSDKDIAQEIENNAQGILGYVVRWVDQGVGCSKVPDIHDVGLMEDRATCRISSQALANWLLHEVVGEAQVMAAMRKMAVIVDRQNEGDPFYQPMAPGYDGIAFQAACDLVFRGREQPSGYTEPVLHARRLQLKASLKG